MLIATRKSRQNSETLIKPKAKAGGSERESSSGKVYCSSFYTPSFSSKINEKGLASGI